jgi:2-methylcitrate dehydratase PrpD
LTKRVDYPLGHAKNPLKDFEVEKKFLSLVVPAFSRDHAAKIIEHVWSLDEQKDVHHLMKLVRVH